MEHVTGRLERDVERLREEVRDVHAIALRAEAKVDTHEDSCVEASRRTQEKIDGVDKKVDGLRADIRERREEDAVWRRDRQNAVDMQTAEWRESLRTRLDGLGERVGATEAWNRRVGVAVVIAAIAIVGGILGTAAKPFVGPAVEAVRTLQGR